MHADLVLPIRANAFRLGESSSDLLKRMEDVLAGAERVLAKVRARAVRLTRLPASQRDTVRLPRGRVGQCVVGPDFLRFQGREPHLLGPGTLLALRNGLGDQNVLGQIFNGCSLGWCVGQPERELLLQDQREGGAGMLAGGIAGVTAPFEAVARRGTEGKRDRRAVHSEAKFLLIKFNLAGDIDVVLAASHDEATSLGTQKLRRPGEGQAREGIEQRQLGARFRQHHSSGAVSFPGSVGGMNCTSHPKGSTAWMRLGSTILTSDSPAKNVVMRMLERAVLTAT